MDVQENMKERLLTLCQRMARRKSTGQKKRTLLQLSEMLGTLGYRTALIGKKGIHGQQLIGGDPENIVRLSPVELDENSEIVKCGGALRYYKDSIIKKRIRLRYVMVRVPLFGNNRDILLGIRVDKEKILNAMDLD